MSRGIGSGTRNINSLSIDKDPRCGFRRIAVRKRDHGPVLPISRLSIHLPRYINIVSGNSNGGAHAIGSPGQYDNGIVLPVTGVLRINIIAVGTRDIDGGRFYSRWSRILAAL